MKNVANTNLVANSEAIKTSVISIDKSYSIITSEKENVKIQSERLLTNVMKVISETDNQALNELNPTYSGINHAYVKVQALLSEIDTLDNKTDKIIKVIIKVLLMSPKVPFNQFIKSFKDFETFAKNSDLLRDVDFVSNDTFNARINDIIMLKTFITTYKDKEKQHNISKEFRKAFAGVECNEIINGTKYDSYIVIVKEFKITNVALFDNVLIAFKEAQKVLKEAE